MDQQQPQWTPPPQQPTGWGGPGYGGAPVRPTGVTLASIYLIVMGILLGLFGACVGLLGGGLAQIEGQAGSGTVFGGAIAVIGLVVLVVAIAGIAAGAGALGGKGWARWTGVVVSILMVIVFALFALGSMGSNQTTTLIFSIVVAVGFALTAWVFISSTAWFARR